MEENCSRSLTSASSVVLASLNGVSGFLTITGNLVILLALYKTPFLKKTTSNYFVGSLACADLSVGLFANSLYIALSGFVSLQEIQELKNAETFVWLLTTTVTTFNLCFVAIDRYIAIIYPLRYSGVVTANRLLRAVICMWIFAVLFAAISFYLPYNDLPILWTIGSVVTFFLPLGVLLFCYFRIYLVVKALNLRRKRQPTFDSLPPSAEELKNRKAAATFGIITGLFAALFLPTLLVNFAGIALERQCHRIKLNIAWFWVAAVSYSSSAINPWIYAIRMSDFRRAIKQLLHRVLNPISNTRE
ncbi:beta-3 adrenergic receptor-like [Oculina patagonica]